MTKQPHYLVTGGAGFIGSHLAQALVRDGCRVRVLDNLSGGSLDNLAEISSAIEFVEGDVRNPEVVRDAALGIDGIFHLAALVSVPRSLEYPEESFSNNIAGSFNVFEAARLSDNIPVVFASSAAVYGDNDALPLSEDATLKPLTPYACDKVYAETLAATYAESYGLPSTGLRFFNVYGERQDPASSYSGVISIFIDRMLQGEPLQVYGDGEQSRDFVYAGDVADAMVRAMQCSTLGFSRFNVGSGTRITINELIELLGRLQGKSAEVRYLEPRSGDIVHSQADISAIFSAIDWRPKTSNDTGLARLMAWMNDAI
ncbi:NAD-dependent epimerase/dehydratase family protein [Mariprofundus sp. KV]|uniref:NAD-dependent epimerase/dehydratase family protein n=1 Tax=Mariprofundus sp. KV TaxID=2608715 RepID=UPI0015A4DE1C|nr:NAD-dependent epimerase/dehydratase family protein [Mariprofundus sp. KV]NWF35558.1 NAD-dependent epimerase/dehydratase family protein [Mariprofundus sp. KV]